MKVMIFVCGEGLGHTSRCISIGKEMISSGHEVYFAAYGYSMDFIERKDFIAHKIPPEITLIGKAGFLNVKKSILATFKNWEYMPSRWGLIKLRKLLKEIKPDVVISDSYFMGILSARLHTIPCYIIVNQSDMEEFFKGKSLSSKILAEIVKLFCTGMFKVADGVIIPDYPLPHTVCRKNLEFKENIQKKVFFSGPLISKTFEETTAKELKRPHVLCTIGGFGHRKPIFRKVIEAAGMDNSINYTLLSGPSVDPSDFDTIPDNVHIHEFIEDQFPYMKASDVIIAPGGHSTMMEALSFAVPMITIPDKNHSEQQNNAFIIEKDGLGKKLDYSASPEDILKNIRILIDDERYRNKLIEMRELAVKLNGPVAVRMIVEEHY
jgi:UDP-N-acetylglucosamine--N-acetylmuramyl-(pentapeptide) pyrophosphoryl-undecaprenol N-acetylglucosamine transferase